MQGRICDEKGRIGKKKINKGEVIERGEKSGYVDQGSDAPHQAP